MDLCKENFIPHPRTQLLTSSNLQEAAGAIGFPALIKPNISVGARGITMVCSLSDLQDKYDGILRNTVNVLYRNTLTLLVHLIIM